MAERLGGETPRALGCADQAAAVTDRTDGLTSELRRWIVASESSGERRLVTTSTAPAGRRAFRPRLLHLASAPGFMRGVRRTLTCGGSSSSSTPASRGTYCAARIRAALHFDHGVNGQSKRILLSDASARHPRRAPAGPESEQQSANKSSFGLPWAWSELFDSDLDSGWNSF
jgi:hypothetical protein